MKKTTIMKKFFVFFCLFTIGLGYSQDKKQTKKASLDSHISRAQVNPENGYIRCATTEYEKFLQENNPKRMTDAQFESWVTPLIENYKNLQMVSSQNGSIITIPVVVHVIHSGQPVGTAPNITDAQVQSQIDVMNQDFRKMLGTPGYNTNPVGVDTQIQFALAKVDLDGNPTNGIDRINLCQPSWSTSDINSIVKPNTIWDPTQYMNMWSVDFTDNTLLGYAQFPDASGLGGLNTSGGSASTDGVVANYATFGSIDYDDGSFLLTAPYNLGRTMTHEVGHFLGLRHIWGDGSSCSTNTDYCADTPVALAANFSCATTVNSCTTQPGNDMVENYMDYTDDACMNIFTQNQKDRIVVIMNNAARRNSLRASTKDVAIPLFANDAEVKVEASCSASGPSCSAGTGPATQKITIYNRGTANLTAVTLNYNINGGTNYTYSWTGNLATHAFDTFDMPVTSTSGGTINVSIATANNTTDQRVTNDIAAGDFVLPTGPTNYTFNALVFKLQRDKYGSETTWNLKNSAGTILYSGGPYTDATGTSLPALISQNWNLASNDCYTFTINDTYGDGICCAEGAGYYNIKSSVAAGSILVAEGGSYGTGETKSFRINYILSNSEFETSKNIFVYPNPTKDILNVSVPSEFGLPNSLKVTNYLGQTIATKTIQSENDLTINTSSLSVGVYFITIVKDNEQKTLRFIKE